MRVIHTCRKVLRQLIALPFELVWLFCAPTLGHQGSFKVCCASLTCKKRFDFNRDNLIEMACKCCAGGDRQFQNVILLSVSFMLVFTAFQTMGNIEQTVLDSIKNEEGSTFKGDGYTSLSIIYGVFSISNWIAPSIVAVLKAKIAMIFGAVLYTAFIASFLYPLTWLLYLMSAILGLGAAVIWTAQGSYLTMCSNDMTMSRNSGIFWAILQSSMFLGNSFVFWQFEGKSEIDKDTRNLVFSVLTAVAVIGVIFLCFLRTPQSDEDLALAAVGVHVPSESALSALQKSLKLFTRKNMILLAFTFFYTGIELSFFSGVYSSSVGFTNNFPEAKRLVGLCGILVGGGEVFGGALFGLLGSRTVKNGRDPIVLLGFLCHTTAFYLVFLNLPDLSPFGPTSEHSFIHNPSVLLAMLCAFLLGFGDSCYNTQIYSILGGLYPDESAPAFALFKFTQSAAAAASFFYSSKITLRAQLVILETFCVLGTLTFFMVEWASVKKQRSIQTPESCADDNTTTEEDSYNKD